MTAQKEDPIKKEYYTFLTKYYPLNPQNEQEKLIDKIHSLIEIAKDDKQTVKAVIETTGRIIHRYFEFGEVGIGLKSRKDGIYRYEYLFGFRKEIEKNFMKTEYNYEDMTNPEKFPFVKVGKYAELDPVEGLPEEEISLLNRPAIVGKKRESFEDFLEGDYFDILMYGNNNELIGWIDLSLTKTGKLPSRSCMRWIELIANICGLAIQKKWNDEDLK